MFILAKARHRNGLSGIDSGRDRFVNPTLSGSLAIAVLILLWIVVVLARKSAQFAVLAPTAAIGVEAASALARWFGALVLFWFPDERVRPRLSWVALGFIIMGSGAFAYGFLVPLVTTNQSPNHLLYESMLVWTLAEVLFAIGLLPARVPALTKRHVMLVVGAAVVLGVMMPLIADHLPQLIHAQHLDTPSIFSQTPLNGLTTWHWVFSSMLVVLAVAAAVGAAREYIRGTLGSWLVIAMVVWAGSQVHNMFWPSPYNPVLTTADVLRLTFAIIVAVGGVVELRRVATERATLLAAQRELTNRLTELAIMKADFTAMVVHELHSPLAAIRAIAAVLQTGELGPEHYQKAAQAISTETDLLNSLVSDVQSIASLERDDFAIAPRPVSLDGLLTDAQAFASRLLGGHPVSVNAETGLLVRADPERIGQVLRNLVSNSATYSADGTPIEIRATRSSNRVRVEVADQGYGVHPEDLGRIFEKFGRGRDATGMQSHGVGLGLYLSRRIVRAHGSDISVDTSLGAGSVFAFELETFQ
jgi:signal transduction histidine kinase